MKQVEIAAHFQVSRACVRDWKTRGAPITGDVGDIAAWRVKRDLRQDGADKDPAFQELPALIGELERKRAALHERIEELNSIPDDSRGNTLGPRATEKVIGLRVAMLELALLELPAKILNTPEPTSLPVRLFQAVLEILAEARGDEGGST